jgi:hypothetical protein
VAVAVVTGGGSGHEPAFFGYVDPGWGGRGGGRHVFASPLATPIVEVVRSEQCGMNDPRSWPDPELASVMKASGARMPGCGGLALVEFGDLGGQRHEVRDT